MYSTSDDLTNLATAPRTIMFTNTMAMVILPFHPSSRSPIAELPAVPSTSPHSYDPSDPQTNVFSLPRELRDIVYEYALVDPTLHSQRHNSTCPYWSPARAHETPMPSCLHRAEQKQTWMSSGLYPNHICADSCDWCTIRPIVCMRLCRAALDCHYCEPVGRYTTRRARSSGRTTCSVSRVFFDKNLFCFQDSDELFASLGGMGAAALSKIRRLSMLGDTSRHSESPWYCYREDVRATFKFLARMPNLVELEPLPWWMLDLCLSDLQPLSRLRVLRAVMLSAAWAGNDWGSRLRENRIQDGEGHCR